MLSIGQELKHPVNNDTCIYLGTTGEGMENLETYKPVIVKYRGEILHLNYDEFIFEPIRNEDGEILVGKVVDTLGLDGYYFGMIDEKYWNYIPERIDELNKLVEKEVEEEDNQSN